MIKLCMLHKVKVTVFNKNLGSSLSLNPVVHLYISMQAAYLPRLFPTYIAPL